MRPYENAPLVWTVFLGMHSFGVHVAGQFLVIQAPGSRGIFRDLLTFEDEAQGGRECRCFAYRPLIAGN